MVSKTLKIGEGETNDDVLFLKGKMRGNGRALEIKIEARPRNPHKFIATVTVGRRTYGKRVIRCPKVG
jgi:hypothetical protein